VVKFDSLISKLERGAISKNEFEICLYRMKTHFDSDIDSEVLKCYGLPLSETEDEVFLSTTKTPYKDEVFCIVDIETNGNSPIKNQIIEIGAIKYKNGEILDRFESYVYADYIPDSIVRLTNIHVEDLVDAPSLKSVLQDFKAFLGSSVFVAHNVNFDFSFISKSLQTVGDDELLNRKLCTVDLSRKTIEAPKHGLGFLKEFLEIDEGEHHRAFSDALSAAKVLDACIQNLPQEVKTTEDLIKFSKRAPRKVKKEPKTSTQKEA
jgi:DNA polymerase-3 subunit epsilon